MKIVVAGCGKIGTTIIASLVSEGHDIVAVDSDSAVVAEISNIYDVMCVCGGVTDVNTLGEADVQKAELFVAVTGSDEMNMLACFLAKKMGAQNTIARIRSPLYNEHNLGFLKQQLDINAAINPEQVIAKELYNILKFPSADSIETFSRRQFELIHHRLKPESILDGLSLIEMRKKYAGNYLVGTVERDDEVFIPDGNFVLKAGDRVGFTASPAEIQKLFKALGILQKKARNVMILGASRTSYYLAKLLLASGNPVKIIEQDRAKCEEFSEFLDGAIIIEGDGAQQELLLEEGIASTDAFVALTGIDEENILISFFAKAQNVPKVISKVNRGELASMAEKLGLDTIVSPKTVVTDLLSRYARALENSLGSNVETLYKLMDGKAEALEFIVKEDFMHQNIPLHALKLKKNILIAGIIRNRKAIIPGGNDVILAGDHIVVLAAGHYLNDLSDILD
ncbi:MAG: Trk system potassium transporter TrkA [Oscillospiraceae bacterium]|nr:Trk system potassium transporter TrkA [Oscillospiraceae bacterium]